MCILNSRSVQWLCFPISRYPLDLFLFFWYLDPVPSIYLIGRHWHYAYPTEDGVPSVPFGWSKVSPKGYCSDRTAGSVQTSNQIGANLQVSDPWKEDPWRCCCSRQKSLELFVPSWKKPSGGATFQPEGRNPTDLRPGWYPLFILFGGSKNFLKTF